MATPRCGITSVASPLCFFSRAFFFFKQKTAYEIPLVTGVQTCALPISAAEEAPEGIAADAVLAPVAQPRAELAAVNSRMGRLALVDLSLWPDDPVTARLGWFACKHEI